MKRLLLIAFILTATNVSFSQNYLLLSTGATGPTGTGNSAIYQDPATSNIGIGNVSPAATLDVSGATSYGTIINPEYTYPGGVGVAVPAGSPNYFVASRVGYALSWPPGSGETYTAAQTDFMINNIGQVGIGSPAMAGIDLFIQNHAFAPNNSIVSFAVFDNNNKPLVAVVNAGSSGAPGGLLWVGTNSTNSWPGAGYNSAFIIQDLSAAPSAPKIFNVLGYGLVDIGSGNVTAQLDVMQNNSVTDYLLHVGSYATETSDFLTVHNNGYIGMGKYNPGNALVEVSDVNSIGATGTPLFLIDNGTGKSYLRVTGTTSGSQPGTALQLFAGANSGWPTQIQFWNADATSERHLITDDFGTGNLLIWPGWGAGASNVVEIAGNEQVDGTVLIGDVPMPCTSGSCYQLYVQQGILAERFKCAASTDAVNWSDYVFDKKYKLMSVDDLDKFVKKNKHLPNIPTADDVKNDGIDLGDMDAKILAKIEELSLYIIDQQKQIDELKKKIR
jgi:hypothetical protein